jgi:Amt family ammonium transporter
MTAATLVGLMSIPALAVLYGGLVQKKWAMNTVLMVFSTFCLVLITWVLWAYKMGFGTPLISTFVGDPRTILGANALQGQANIPLLNGLMPSFKLPAASVEYFQFVFAAITPILFIGSVLGRISFKVWLIFVPLWITFAYTVNAFLLWGGGYWAGKGARVLRGYTRTSLCEGRRVCSRVRRKRDYGTFVKDEAIYSGTVHGSRMAGIRN